MGLEDDLYPQLRAGDILCTREKGPLSYAIRKISKSKYSHALCYIGYGLTIESNWNGVEINEVDALDNFDVFRHTNASEIQLLYAVKFMCEKEGKKYDYLGLFGILLNIMKITKGNKLDDKDAYWCSELIADGYLHAGIPLHVEKNTSRVSPQNLIDDYYIKMVFKKR